MKTTFISKLEAQSLGFYYTWKLLWMDFNVLSTLFWKIKLFQQHRKFYIYGGTRGNKKAYKMFHDTVSY